MDDNGGRAQAPPQKLALAFSTADVVVLGWRLGHLADRLQENNLAAVRILPKRFAELERNQPYVAFIGITPIANCQGMTAKRLKKPGISRKSRACRSTFDVQPRAGSTRQSKMNRTKTTKMIHIPIRDAFGSTRRSSRQ